jgi:hypothetical protein
MYKARLSAGVGPGRKMTGQQLGKAWHEHLKHQALPLLKTPS